MASFSIEDALGSGFRVIRRTPGAVLLWAVTYMLLMLPVLGVFAAMLPEFAALRGQGGHVAPDPARLTALHQEMLALEPLIWITSIAVNTVMTAAIYRAVLQPEERRWAYLRLGAAELWLGLVTLVFMVLLALGLFTVAFLLGLGLGLAAMSGHAGGAASAVAVLLGIAGGAAIIYVGLRLSLGLPMSFAGRQFLLFESWALTRGRALKLFLAALAILGVVLLLELAMVLVLGGVLLAAGGLGVLRSLHGSAHVPAIFGLAFLALIPIWTVVAAVVRTLMIAPLADIYRQLTGDSAPA